MRLALSAVLALTILVPPSTVVVSAGQGDRTLYLYHTHTGQSGHFTFKRNGRYDQAVLKELNIFLADWRTKEPTKMDPALFDLLWAVYQDVGAREPISIVSSYRTPKTNAMLASKSSGVADNSLHMKGKAIDFFIKGIDLSLLRQTVMRHQVGGIGYYPTSGSPFVHADTGNVRAWPRMTRAQLKKVFPDGRTLHLPTDGTPLSSDGRRYAEAEWKKCHAVPCSSSPFGIGGGGGTTMVASLEEAPSPAERPRTLMDMFFGGSDQQAEVKTASLGGDPEQRVVPTFDITAPIPAMRGAALAGGIDENGAPIPAQKSERLMLATLSRDEENGVTALAALDAAVAPVPRPRELMSPEIMSAYAKQDPEAERALRMIIERETAMRPSAPEPEIRTASLGGSDNLDALKGMFDLTFNALTDAAAPAPVAMALAGVAEARQSTASIDARPTELVAPELDHVNETLVEPVLMSATHFAVLTEAEGYLDKGTELGPLTVRMGFRPASAQTPAYDRFVIGAPLLIASR